VKMVKRYSIAIYPSKYVIDFVKSMKDLLKSKVKGNWYSSCNSVGHITICEFEIDESQIEKIKQKLYEICDTFIPFQVYLDHFGAYKNSNAFYIGTNENSKIDLEPIMKKMQDYCKSLKPLEFKKSNDPHMSIGRKLTPENLKIASELFTTIDIDFLCDSIVLRELEPYKQFFVIETFLFGSNPKPELIQGTLF
jgi:2'-5' RNA ligase